MKNPLEVLADRDAKVLAEMKVIQDRFTADTTLPTSTMLKLKAQYENLNDLSYFLKCMAQAFGKVNLLVPQKSIQIVN